MAVFTTNNLYPGAIDTAMPGFDINDGQIKVYFDFTKYNDSSSNGNIKQGNYIQVSLRYQNNNLNALNDVCGIILKGWSNDSKGTYFLIQNVDLKDGAFLPYQYYKLQYRLTDKAASDKTNNQTIDQWLSANSTQTGKTNLDESSEWSTVCLIRGITTESMSIVGFNNSNSSIENPINVPNGFDELIGEISFSAASNGAVCTENLKSLKIKLYNGTSTTILKESNDLYSSDYENINQFRYNFKYNFLTGSSNIYRVEIISTTNSLYEKIFTYYFYLTEDSSSIVFTPTLFKAEANEEEGFIKLILSFDSFPSADANAFAIYRTSSKDNYTTVEKIYQKTKTDSTGVTKFSLWDITIESGILYKYSIRAINTNTGAQSIKTELENSIGVVLNHIFLDQENKQLKIKFNPSISSMKTIYTENKTETLGSQYPFIKRGGAVKYKTFPIGGLISYFMDDNNLFTSRTNIYGSDNINDYNNFNKNNNITSQRDYTYERLFREKVQEFLEDGAIKLFRSPTEGNILVRLMDINFSPNQNNGRMIWSFSATAYEIAEPSLENLNKYKIQVLDNINTSTDGYVDDVFLYSVMPANNELSV